MSNFGLGPGAPGILIGLLQEIFAVQIGAHSARLTGGGSSAVIVLDPVEVALLDHLPHELPELLVIRDTEALEVGQEGAYG